MSERPAIIQALTDTFGSDGFTFQHTADGVPTLWIPRSRHFAVLSHLKRKATPRFRMLLDLTAVDERLRKNRQGLPEADFTVVYHLLSLEPTEELRIKVALRGEYPDIDTITGLWPKANWYEREVWDMFGITFNGHPNLRRILMPPTWEGHPLRKEHPARATEMGRFTLPDEKQDREQAALQFKPEEWGMKRETEDAEFMFLNIGPQHPGTHGVIRIALQLDGEEIVDSVVDIGYHHRGAEKMGERQSFHSYIPYTDRVDYLGGVMNNLPYVMAVEKLAGIEIPDRVKLIRIALCELFRISNHLVWYGTFAQDVGQFSPVVYMFNDREKVLGLIEAICGARMHPNWFRIGGLAADLPKGWDKLFKDLITYLPPRLDEYDKMVMGNSILKGRCKGIGAFSTAEAIDWGVTGPALRATGMEWDLRKARPYGGYDQLDFEVPTATGGDCFARAEVRVEEIRQSLRIIEQCVKLIDKTGPYKSEHPLAVPPTRDGTMHDIETLITHFLSVSWGPVMPAGESSMFVEGTKGLQGYYLTSDKDTISYRTRIRVPSFPHVQIIPDISRGHMVPDLLAIVAATDYLLSEIDR
ncbi:MAG: NADH-quinone oxidoreductase subunit C/D [Opitutales bacterium]